MALPLLGSMRGYRLKMRKGMTGGRSRGGSEVPGVVTCAQASAVWHSAVIGKRHPRPGTDSRADGGRIVLGQPDRDQRVVAKAFAEIGDDRFAVPTV
jgi:hypothetical protein